MNALIFKKCLEIKNNKLRLISFFILPIMCFLITIYFQIPMEKVAFYCPLCISLLNVLVFWNQENIVLSGDLIFTPLTPQKIWLTNAIFPTIVYYAYCYILLILTISMYCLCFNLSIPFSCLFYGLLNIIPAIGITVFSTLSNIENTRIKQWISAPISLLNIFSFMFFLISYNYLSVNLITIAWSNIIGVILLVIALILNKKIDNENILHFSDNNFFSEKNGVIE